MPEHIRNTAASPEILGQANPLNLEHIYELSQVRAHPISLWEEAQIAITPDILEQAFAKRYGSKGFENKIKNPKYVDAMKRKLANAFILDAFDAQMPQAPSFEVFSWELDELIKQGERGIELRIRKKALNSEQRETLGVNHLLIRALDYVQAFSKQHPALSEKAISLWARKFEEQQKSYASPDLFKCAFSDREFSKVNRYPNRYARHRLNVSCLDDLLDIAKADSESILGIAPKTKAENLLRSLEADPLLQTRIEIHEFLNKNLIFDNDLHATSRDLLRISSAGLHNYYRTITNLDARFEDLFIGKFTRTLEALRSGDGSQYADVTRLADKITPVINKAFRLDLQTLSPRDIGDYPRAIDRLIYFARAAGQTAIAAAQEEERIDVAGENLRFIAFLAAGSAVEGRKLTSDEARLRYPNTDEVLWEGIKKALYSQTEPQIQALYRVQRMAEYTSTSNRRAA